MDSSFVLPSFLTVTIQSALRFVFSTFAVTVTIPSLMAVTFPLRSIEKLQKSKRDKI